MRIIPLGNSGLGFVIKSRYVAARPTTPPAEQTDIYILNNYIKNYNQSSMVGAIIENYSIGFVQMPGVTPNIRPGSTFNEHVMNFECYQGTHGTHNDSVYTSIRIIEGSTRPTCNYNGQSSVNISLGTETITPQIKVGELFGKGYNTELSLTCEKGVTPYMTISDTRNPGNRGNTIGLASESVAKGVGIQVFYNNQSSPSLLGPISSDPGTTNQFKVGNAASNDEQSVKIPLKFQLIRTEENVIPGDLKAYATVTFSYQ